MKKREFNKELELEIAELYKVGFSVYKLEKKYNINAKILRRILVENGVKLRETIYNTQKLRKPKTNINELIAFYKECKNINKSSEKFKISKNTVKRYLLKEGIAINDKFSKKKPFTEEEKKEIIRLYTKEIRGAKYIGKLFDRSDSVISGWLKKWGIPKNTRSEISLKLTKTTS